MHNKTLLPSLADFIGFGAFIFCVVGGCNSLMEDDQIPITSSEDTQVMVPERNLLLFADLDDYYITPPDPDTKSSESLTPLSSLLDESGTTSLDFEGTHFVQTPFLSNREQVLFSRSSILPNEGDPVSPDSLLYLKKFYIRETTPDGILSSYVVTMITGKQYCDVFGYENINFLEKPNYTGYIIFSETDGDVDCVYFYENGLILDSYLLKRGEQPEENSESTFITPVKCENSTTKGNATLDPAYCISRLIITIYLPYIPPDRPDGNEKKDNPEDKLGKGGGGTSNSDTNTDNDKRPKLYLTVTAVSADPTMGTVSGGGYYERGSTVTLYTRAKYIYKSRIPYILNFWSGDVSGNSTTVIIRNLNGNKSAVAHFCAPGDELKPCWNGLTNVRNPLVEMSIAASAGSGYRGGTYGYTRWTKNKSTGELEPKEHKGIDLYAEIGTPIFAMSDGIISGLAKNCPTGRDGSNYCYGTGNFVKVKDGNAEYLYAHLQCGSPIAINPRTGEPFKAGDDVYQGDIIGYTGRSGNAWSEKDVPNPHLHLTIFVNGKRVDPAPYLNGTVSIKDGRIYGIMCDD